MNKEPKREGRIRKEEKYGWETFHRYLLQNTTTYPLLKPRFWRRDYDDMTTDTYQSCTDEQMWIFRRDHIDIFYPYLTKIYKDVYSLSAMITFRIMERCFPAGFLVVHEWSTTNVQHRYVRPEFSYNVSWSINAQMEYLNMKLPELSPWNISSNTTTLLKQRCTVKQSPSYGFHPQCKAVTESLFQRWIDGEYAP